MGNAGEKILPGLLVAALLLTLLTWSGTIRAEEPARPATAGKRTGKTSTEPAPTAEGPLKKYVPLAPPGEHPARQKPSKAKAEPGYKPCSLANVTDAACASQLGSEIEALLLAQGEDKTMAKEAGESIAQALPNAPAENRTGLRLQSPASGKEYLFMFNNENGGCVLQLVELESEGAKAIRILAARPLPACGCAP